MQNLADVQHCYDKNGQVFTETTIRPRPVFKRALLAISKIPLERDSRANIRGSPALQDICIRECLRNIKEITADILECIPWQVGRRLWETVEDINPQDIRSVWQAFAAAYPDEQSISYHRSADSTPYDTLPEYISSLTSHTTSWLTALTISNVTCFRADVMRISELTNLVALDICGSNPKSRSEDNELVDDTVIRAWARHTDELGRLSRLRVLIMRNQHGVTSRSFEYLNSFPSLTLFGVKGCGITNRHSKSANLVGWTVCDSTNDADLANDLRRDIELAHTWDEPLRSCVRRAEWLANESNKSDTKDAHACHGAKPIPLLNFRIGITSNDVLFSTPLLFFRCGTPRTAHKHAAPSSTSPISRELVLLDVPTPDATNLHISAEVPTATASDSRNKADLRRGMNTISGGTAAAAKASAAAAAAAAAAASSTGTASSDEWAGTSSSPLRGNSGSGDARTVAKRPKLRAEALRSRDLREQFMLDTSGEPTAPEKHPRQ